MGPAKSFARGQGMEGNVCLKACIIRLLGSVGMLAELASKAEAYLDHVTGSLVIKGPHFPHRLVQKLHCARRSSAHRHGWRSVCCFS